MLLKVSRMDILQFRVGAVDNPKGQSSLRGGKVRGEKDRERERARAVPGIKWPFCPWIENFLQPLSCAMEVMMAVQRPCEMKIGTFFSFDESSATLRTWERVIFEHFLIKAALLQSIETWLLDIK